jgi:hypothetical protein
MIEQIFVAQVRSLRREDTVTEPPTGDVSNVLAFRQSRRPHPDLGRAPECDMAEALQSVELIEQCALALRSSPLSIASETEHTELPIVSLQAQLPVIQRWLDYLAQITVANSLDTRWALRLGDTRSTAATHLRIVMRSLHRDPPGPGPLSGQLAIDIQKFADVLRKLRQLLTQQSAASRRAP